MNQIYEKEKLEVVEKKKSLAVRTSLKKELKIEVRANLCFMAIDNEVCDDELNDYDDLQNEYKGLLKDYEKIDV